uniref:Uncharacterized protein n=1 Tax=Anguilla anguilla TaxID=7936 RepID=A0A0E9V996_ANGAN
MVRVVFQTQAYGPPYLGDTG